jgi:hypothetical protein
MDRRQFCRTAIAAGVAASYPLLSACERAATTVDTSVAAVSLGGAEIGLGKAAIKELSESMTGPLILSGQPDYDVARTIWNAMHDRRPALIARCLNSADVSNAVTFARERELLVSVRGGGHSFPGKSVCDGGLMIDLSMLDGVDVGVANQRATAGGGALLGALDAATLEHGLVTTAGVVSHTGVGGYTLGGGFGKLNRMFGLTVDNLVSAELVTADGEVRKVSEEENPDLFWAIRGGGGNFGVATKFEYQLHPFDRNLLGGGIIWPIEQAAEVMDFYGDWIENISDELYVGPLMLSLPDGQQVILMDCLYCGDPVQGEKEVAALRKIGKPMMDGLALNDYMALQTANDAAFGHGRRNFAKSGMVKSITPELLTTLHETFPKDPRLVFATHTAGGAVAQVDELATAFPHRNIDTMLVGLAIWGDSAEDQGAIASLKEWWSHLEPYTGGYYENLSVDTETTAVGNYGPVYGRLSEIKAEYDPMNLFRMNSNVTPMT